MGKSSSSSQANQSTQYTNSDDRIVNESGIVARDSTLMDNSSTTSNWLTNYAIDDKSNSGNTTITNDAKVMTAAFDFASGASATNGQGFDKLLTTAAELTKTTQSNATSLASKFQDGIAQAWDAAKTTTPGGIDNKTMIILGVAAAGAVAVYAMNKGR